MNIITQLTNLARSPGDPKILEGGPSARNVTDQMASKLGWFSIGLGISELVAARHIARALGVEGKESVVRAFGVREVLAGVMSLSIDKSAGLWARVGGDALDATALIGAYTSENPKRHNVGLALAAVAGIAALDVAVAAGLKVRHGRGGAPRDYSGRGGWPSGIEASRGAARSS